MWVWCKPGERAFAVRYRMKIFLNPEVQRNDFNVYRSSTFGQASITKAGTSWKWEEGVRGRFMDSRTGSKTSLSVFEIFFEIFFLKFSLWQFWVFLPSAVRRSSEFFGMFSFFVFVRCFFGRVLRKNFALRYLDSVKPFSFVWPSPIFF